MRLRQSQGGFTLLEIIMSVGIMAVVIGVASQFIGRNAERDIRAESFRLIRAISYCYHEASAQNRYYRVAFDLDQQNYLLESSDKSFAIAAEGDEKEALRLRKRAERLKLSGETDDEAPASPDGVAAEDTASDAEQQSAKKPDFVEVEDDLLDQFRLPVDVRLKQVFIQHQKEPATAGQAWLYCFPRGQTEFAVIQFVAVEDDEEGDIMTLGVSPITGRVSVFDEELDQDEVLKRLGGESR